MTMPDDKTVNDDVNADDVVVDNVMDDHDAGLGTSAEGMETHNPDMADFDKAIETMDAADDKDDDSSGGTENTDDSDKSDDDASGAKEDDDKVDDKDEPKIPRARLNEVIDREKATIATHHEKELAWARKEAIFEGRLAALEKPAEAAAPVADPLDDILKGEPQQVLDAFTSDPTGFIRMVQSQARQETTTSIQAQREEEAYNQALNSGLSKFGKDHEDFFPNSERLMGIVNENPLHNIISAYYEEIAMPLLTSQIEEATKGVEDKVAEAKAAGITEGKKLAIKEIQAKGNATVLDGSAANQSGSQANVGLETGGDGTSLRDQLTKELLAKRAATG
jgi:hypothetical protein